MTPFANKLCNYTFQLMPITRTINPSASDATATRR